MIQTCEKTNFEIVINKHSYLSLVGTFSYVWHYLLNPCTKKLLYCFPDWGECFSVILGGDQVPNGKPSPDMYL